VTKTYTGMIIILNKNGQLCNNIWSYIPSIISAIHSKQSIRVFGFDDYYQYFVNLNSNANVKFVKIITERNMCMFPYYIEFTNKLSSFLLKGKNKRSVFKMHLIDPWKYTLSFHEVIRNEDRNIIQNIFRFKSEILIDVRRFLKRCNYEIIIGVHIRRKDYRSYNNGTYYYENSVYIKLMYQLQSILGKSIMFCICSDENVDSKCFPQNTFLSPFNSPVHDLCILSKCNYIIGPHSTYSMYASFIGEVPLRFINSNEDSIKSLAEFKICRFLDQFE
jgi:hypothetical protein